MYLCRLSRNLTDMSIVVNARDVGSSALKSIIVLFMSWRETIDNSVDSINFEVLHEISNNCYWPIFHQEWIKH